MSGHVSKPAEICGWTLDRIRARCIACGDGCWLWQGGSIQGAYPFACDPAPERASGQRRFYVRRRVYELAQGKPAPNHLHEEVEPLPEGAHYYIDPVSELAEQMAAKGIVIVNPPKK